MRSSCCYIRYYGTIQGLPTADKELTMPVSCDDMWRALIDKNMNRAEQKDFSEISFNVLVKNGKNEYVSMDSLHWICQTISAI